MGNVMELRWYLDILPAMKARDSCETVTVQYSAGAAIAAWLSQRRPLPKWHLLREASPSRRGSRIIAVVRYPRRLTRAATACPAAVLHTPVYTWRTA